MYLPEYLKLTGLLFWIMHHQCMFGYIFHLHWLLCQGLSCLPWLQVLYLFLIWNIHWNYLLLFLNLTYLLFWIIYCQYMFGYILHLHWLLSQGLSDLPWLQVLYLSLFWNKHLNYLLLLLNLNYLLFWIIHYQYMFVYRLHLSWLLYQGLFCLPGCKFRIYFCFEIYI